MEDIKNLFKIILLTTLPCISIGMFSHKDYFLGALCLLSFCIILYVAIKSFKDLFPNDNELHHHKQNYNITNSKINWWNNATNNSDAKDIEDVSDKCKINKNIIDMEAVDTTSITFKLPPIKELVAKELDKKENIIDLTKENKPSISMDNIQLETSNVVTKSINNNVSKQETQTDTAILIRNKSTLTNEEKGTYKTIIEVLDKYELMADKKYALLQSFVFIDVCQEGIIIYIDYDILKKAKLDEIHLHKEEIISLLKEKMHCQQLIVQFEEYKVKNLGPARI